MLGGLADGAKAARGERAFAQDLARGLGQLDRLRPADVAAARALGGLDVAPDVVTGPTLRSAAEALDDNRVHGGSIGLLRGSALP